MIPINPPMPDVPPSQTVVDMIRHSAAKRPIHQAVVCGAQHLSWRDFDYRINRVANMLLVLGLGKGDNIAILSPNSIAYSELFMGILRAGACVTCPSSYKIERQSGLSSGGSGSFV